MLHSKTVFGIFAMIMSNIMKVFQCEKPLHPPFEDGTAVDLSHGENHGEGNRISPGFSPKTIVSRFLLGVWSICYQEGKWVEGKVAEKRGSFPWLT